MISFFEFKLSNFSWYMDCKAVHGLQGCTWMDLALPSTLFPVDKAHRLWPLSALVS